MGLKEEILIAARLLWFTCDAPNCEERTVVVNPTPNDRVRGPAGWKRSPTGVWTCPAH